MACLECEPCATKDNELTQAFCCLDLSLQRLSTIVGVLVLSLASRFTMFAMCCLSSSLHQWRKVWPLACHWFGTSIHAHNDYLVQALTKPDPLIASKFSARRGAHSHLQRVGLEQQDDPHTPTNGRREHTISRDNTRNERMFAISTPTKQTSSRSTVALQSIGSLPVRIKTRTRREFIDLGLKRTMGKQALFHP